MEIYLHNKGGKNIPAENESRDLLLFVIAWPLPHLCFTIRDV